MRFTNVAACLLLAVAFAFGENVLVATAENFDEIVKTHDKLVVEFYAPWCGHCKKLEPEYEKAAADLKAEGITLAKMDATEEANKAITPKFGVRGFPTIKVIRDHKADKHEAYEGPRDHAGIVRYVKKLFGPASAVLASAEEAAGMAEGGIAVFGIFPKLEGEEYDTFVAVAESNRKDLDFAHTTDAAHVAQCSGVEGKCEKPTLLVLRPFDEPVVPYTGSLTDKAAIQAFLEKAQVPRVIELAPGKVQQKAFQTAWRNEKPKLLVFCSKEDEGGALMGKFKDAMVAVGDKVTDVQPVFVEFGSNKRQVEQLGATEDKVPMVMMLELQNDAKYVKTKAKPDDLMKFVEDYKAGKIERYIKSAPIPEDPYEDDVRVLVAKNLEEEVTKSGKDVLVEFYAPWCGHCKKLAPTWSALAKKLKDQPNVVIAKMDATANDVTVSDFNVRGFPTIYFWDGKKGKAKTYSGERTEEAFIKFIKENSSQYEEAKAEAEEEAEVEL